MEKRIAPRSPRALTAIAAVLALAATPMTPAFAQETGTPAQQVPTAPTQAHPLPPTIAPDVATPMIVLPQVESPPPASPPPAEIASAAPAATAKPETAPRAHRTAPPQPDPARVPTAENPDATRIGALARGNAPAAVVSPPTPPFPTAPSPTERPTPIATNNSARTALPTEGAISLLAALGIAAMGIFVMMRRRRDGREGDFTVIYAKPEPAPEPSPIAMADPMALPANPPARLGPSAEALAAGPVPISEDRRDLLETMVDAPPDEANPFTSRKARMRRARLILQHREHLQTQGKPFDWRTYRPTTRPSTPSPSEPLVDA